MLCELLFLSHFVSTKAFHHTYSLKTPVWNFSLRPAATLDITCQRQPETTLPSATQVRRARRNPSLLSFWLITKGKDSQPSVITQRPASSSYGSLKSTLAELFICIIWNLVSYFSKWVHCLCFLSSKPFSPPLMHAILRTGLCWNPTMIFHGLETEVQVYLCGRE